MMKSRICFYDKDSVSNDESYKKVTKCGEKEKPNILAEKSSCFASSKLAEKSSGFEISGESGEKDVRSYVE